MPVKPVGPVVEEKAWFDLTAREHLACNHFSSASDLSNRLPPLQFLSCSDLFGHSDELSETAERPGWPYL